MAPGLLELTPTDLGALTDAELMDRQRSVAQLRRHADAAAAVIAAEIARRSRPELGHDGLAQRLGARTPAGLVQQLTGATAREANTLVRAGAQMTSPDGPSWLHAVANALSAGDVSLDAFEAIRAGLGAPDDHVTADQLREAAGRLLVQAREFTVERLVAAARDARAELDLSRVAERERAMRERRYLHLTRQADGMTRLTGLLDPESAVVVTAAYDAATSPRRGGPRFVDPAAQDAVERLLDDPRSTEQLALDAFVELIRIGTAIDEDVLLDSGRTVTLHVTTADLDRRLGIARFEGQPAPMSIQTADRQLCNSSLVPILFDTEGQVINVGREQRLYNRRQRRALAARDGGCRFPRCDRPPSWTEAHHLTEWQHGGRTDLADGILMCRHHHLLVHNNGWQVTRRGGNYFVIPPPSEDPAQHPIPAPPRLWVQRAAS